MLILYFLSFQGNSIINNLSAICCLGSTILFAMENGDKLMARRWCYRQKSWGRLPKHVMIDDQMKNNQKWKFQKATKKALLLCSFLNQILYKSNFLYTFYTPEKIVRLTTEIHHFSNTNIRNVIFLMYFSFWKLLFYE